jgi:hypothetical protein
MLATCYFTLLTKITGDEFFTNGKGRETLGSTRASRYSDWYDPGRRFLYVKRNAFGTTHEVGDPIEGSMERLLPPQGDGQTRSRCAVLCTTTALSPTQTWNRVSDRVRGGHAF